MKIYVSHSRNYNYRKELYDPLRNSVLNREHEIILPHEYDTTQIDSKELLRRGCDIMIADVTFPSIGVGMEIAYADDSGVPIICVFRKGSAPSSSLRKVTQRFIEYETIEGLISDIEKLLPEFQ